jgi:hypothetical protein
MENHLINQKPVKIMPRAYRSRKYCAPIDKIPNGWMVRAKVSTNITTSGYGDLYETEKGVLILVSYADGCFHPYAIPFEYV